MVVIDNSKPIHPAVCSGGGYFRTHFPNSGWFLSLPGMQFLFFILVPNSSLLFICSHPGENFFPNNLLVNVSLNQCLQEFDKMTPSLGWQILTIKKILKIIFSSDHDDLELQVYKITVLQSTGTTCKLRK